MNGSDVHALAADEADELYEIVADLLERDAVTRRPALYQALMALAADLEDRLNEADPLVDEPVELAVAG
jgi:hypothetical protein